MKSKSSATIDDYIAGFPIPIRALLQEIRRTIHTAAPKAEEAIKYGMPTFILSGNLIHFAAFKNHIGIYPAPVGIPEFEKQLLKYKTHKATMRLPLDEPLPLTFISKLVKYNVKRNLGKGK